MIQIYILNVLLCADIQVVGWRVLLPRSAGQCTSQDDTKLAMEVLMSRVGDEEKILVLEKSLADARTNRFHPINN